MERPVFVECSDCGFFHAGEITACEGADRHLPEDLDEEFGEGGWVEITAEEPVENVMKRNNGPSLADDLIEALGETVAHAKGEIDLPTRIYTPSAVAEGPVEQSVAGDARANFDRMMAVTPETDIEGHQITVGCRVRCYDVARYDAEHDGLIFSHHSYIEGVITEIVKYTPLNWHEGVYYVVDMQTSVSPLIERSRNDYSVRDETQTLNVRGPVHILANGNRLDNDTRSFGVVRLS